MERSRIVHDNNKDKIQTEMPTIIKLQISENSVGRLMRMEIEFETQWTNS